MERIILFTAAFIPFKDRNIWMSISNLLSTLYLEDSLIFQWLQPVQTYMLAWMALVHCYSWSLDLRQSDLLQINGLPAPLLIKSLRGIQGVPVVDCAARHVGNAAAAVPPFQSSLPIKHSLWRGVSPYNKCQLECDKFRTWSSCRFTTSSEDKLRILFQHSCSFSWGARSVVFPSHLPTPKATA